MPHIFVLAPVRTQARYDRIAPMYGLMEMLP